MPCNYAEYHPDWKWIRRQILDQAGDECEFCGVANGTFGFRTGGEFVEVAGGHPCHHDRSWQPKCFRIVLTIAHLDHDITNNEPSNLRALCQACHLRWDQEHHAKNAADTRRLKQVHAGQQVMTVGGLS